MAGSVWAKAVSSSSLGPLGLSVRVLSVVLTPRALSQGLFTPALSGGGCEPRLPFLTPGVLLLHVPTERGSALGCRFWDSWALKFPRRPSPCFPQHTLLPSAVQDPHGHARAVGHDRYPALRSWGQNSKGQGVPGSSGLARNLGAGGSLGGSRLRAAEPPHLRWTPRPPDLPSTSGSSTQRLLQAWRLCPQDTAGHTRDHLARQVFPQLSLHPLRDCRTPRPGTPPALGLFMHDSVHTGCAEAPTLSLSQAALSARVLHCADPFASPLASQNPVSRDEGGVRLTQEPGPSASPANPVHAHHWGASAV